MSYLTLSRLRRLPPRTILSTLLRVRDRCFLLLEDSASEAMLPLMTAIAAATPARTIEIVRADLTRTVVRRRAVLPALGSVGLATIDGYRALASARGELDRLAGEPRLEPQSRGSGVLLVNPNLWLGIKAGGSVGHVSGVVNAMSRAGRDVELAAIGRPSTLDPDVPFHRLHPPSTLGIPPEINYYRFHRSAANQLTALVDAKRPLIYQRLSIASWVGVQLSRRARTPLVIEYNGSEVWVARHWGRPLRYDRLAAAAEEVCLRHAHLVVTVSEVLREELIGRGIDPERIVCHPNGFDREIFDPARFDPGSRAAIRSNLGIPSDAIVATFIGTFGQWHGADVLAAAIADLVRHNRGWVEQTGLRFLLIGDGLTMPEVMRLIAEAGAEAFVTLPGLVPQEATPRYLAASDIFVSPHVANTDESRFFGSPTKLFEYMAMGKPIVASDLEQIGAVLTPSLAASQLPRTQPTDRAGETVAVLTRPGEVSELVTSLRFLVDQPEWRASLGSAARRHALAHFTWDHHVEAIREGLERVVGG